MEQLKKELLQMEAEEIKAISNALEEGNIDELKALLNQWLDDYRGEWIDKCDRCKKWYLKNEGDFEEDGYNWYCFECWDYLDAKYHYHLRDGLLDKNNNE